jgi:hypothetical protein
MDEQSRREIILIKLCSRNASSLHNFANQSTLTTSTLRKIAFGYFDGSWLNSGAIILHGPHLKRRKTGDFREILVGNKEKQLAMTCKNETLDLPRSCEVHDDELDSSC